MNMMGYLKEFLRQFAVANNFGNATKRNDEHAYAMDANPQDD